MEYNSFAMEHISIRLGSREDITNVLSLYPAAFPDEDLLPLVEGLLNADKGVFSLVAVAESKIVGHAAMTICGIDGTETTVALLGPIAVLPTMQKQGIGSSLIHNAIETLETAGCVKLFVLGDPNYYGRFGFVKEESVMTPYPIPKEWKSAWQSINLTDEAAKLAGTLTVPEMWQRPKLWSE